MVVVIYTKCTTEMTKLSGNYTQNITFPLFLKIQFVTSLW